MIQTVLHSLITFIDITALSTLVGVALCLFWTAHSKGDEETSPPFVDSLRRLLMLCLIALVISSISNFIQRTMEMSGLGITAILPVLPTVLFKTHYGRIGLVRSAGLGLALVIMVCRQAASEFPLRCRLSAVRFRSHRLFTQRHEPRCRLRRPEFAGAFGLVSSYGLLLWGGALIAIASRFPSFS